MYGYSLREGGKQERSQEMDVRLQILHSWERNFSPRNQILVVKRRHAYTEKAPNYRVCTRYYKTEAHNRLKRIREGMEGEEQGVSQLQPPKSTLTNTNQYHLTKQYQLELRRIAKVMLRIKKLQHSIISFLFLIHEK